MIFNGLVVDMRMESATFGCAAVDYGEVSLGADRKMVAAGVKMVAAGVKMVRGRRSHPHTHQNDNCRNGLGVHYGNHYGVALCLAHG